VAIRRFVVSKAPPHSSTANCFSIYPAANAKSRSLPLCCASLLDKLKPSLPRNASVLSARVTYSEFGLTFDSNIIARYAARAAELESPQASSTHSALSRAPFRHLHLHHDLKDNTPPSPSAWDAVPPSPRSTRPCRATIVSNPPLRPAHYPMFDPLLPGCLATSVPAPPRVRHATPACPSNRIQPAPPPCGAIPAQATSPPSLGAWGSIPHHHTLLVICVTSDL